MPTRMMNWMDVTALALVIVGALNWGLVGLADYDLVAALLGEGSTLARLVYGIVGIAGAWTVWTAVKASQQSTRREAGELRA